MPRPIRFPPAALAERALASFWRRGYEGTSVDDLVVETGASRHAVYGAFPDKRTLLLACVDVYKRSVVDPAFAIVEQPGAGLTEIAGYFETQIVAAEAAGLPGCGCMIANLTIELAPHDPEVAAAVQSHLGRLHKGFVSALTTSCRRDSGEAEAWAALLVTTAQGVWALARVTSDAAELRRPIAALLDLIEGAMAK